MRFALQTAPLLVIGIALIGCGKEKGDPPQSKVDPSLPTVTLNIPSMH